MSESRPLKSNVFAAISEEAEAPETPAESPVAGVWKTLSGLRRLQVAFSDPKVRRARSAEELAASEARQLLELRLKQVEAATARTEFDLQQEQQEGSEPEAQPTTDIPVANGPSAEQTSPEPQPIELPPAYLLAELNSARAELRLAAETHMAERARWETTCQELERRLTESLADSQRRAELEAALDAARAHLQQAAETHSAELKARLDELKTAAEERTALEVALKTAQAKDREAADTYAVDRASWEATREELKAALEHKWAELRKTIDTHVSERATWTDTRQQLEAAVDRTRADATAASEAHDAELEARGRELREAVAERAIVEDALNAAQRERQKIVDAHEFERAAWSTKRQELEGRVEQFGVISAARAELETALAESQTLLRQNAEQYAADRAEWEIRHQQIQATLDATVVRLKEAADLHASEQSAWAATRHELEMRAQELQTAAEAHGKTRQALHATTTKLRQTADAYASDRTAWDATRQQLEADVNRASAEAVKAAEAHDADLKAHAKELQKAAEAHDAELKAHAEELQRAAEGHDAGLKAHAEELQRAAEGHDAELKAHAEKLQKAVEAHDADLKAHAKELQKAAEAYDTELKAQAKELHRVAEAHDIQLKAHTKELQKATDARMKLEAALAKTQAERQQAVEAHGADRAALAAARRQLEMDVNSARAVLEKTALAHEAELKTRGKELREAIEARTKLEAAFNKAQVERQKATDMHASDRAIWDATRHQLEADVSSARAAMAAAADTHDAELKARGKELKELQDAVDARTRLEAALAKVQMERQGAIDAHASDRAAWNSTRHELEARVRHAETVEQDRQHLQQTLEQARAEYSELRSAHGSIELQMIETTTRLQQLATESEAFRLRVETEFHGDIRAELEARLHEARRLEEVGRLAGAMTPDIKELVSSIDRCGTELARTLDSADPRRQSAQAIVAFSERASGLLRQLLVFSEKQSRPLAPVDVNDAVRRAEPVLAQLVGADIDLKIELGPSGVISAGEDDVDHLVTALVLSARDLLPVGGVLTIGTRRAEPGQVNADQPDGCATGHVLLTVKASGFGVQPAQVTSALELVVQRCAGELYFDGTAANGVVFQVRFSLARPDAQNVPAPSSASGESAGDPASVTPR
jgi:chromosome segregation ATPase